MNKFANLMNHIGMRLEQVGQLIQGKGTGTSISQECKQALTFIKEDDQKVFIDVGGNKGDFTAEILKNLPKARVLVYEPSAKNIEILAQRFKHNPNVQVFGFGLSNDESSHTLFSDSEGSGLGSLIKRRLEHFDIKFDVSEEISTRRFEEEWNHNLGSPEIALCKIDVEGLEYQVLLGFGGVLDHCDVIQFEFGGTHIDSRNYFQDFWYFFEDKGFDLHRISPIGPIPIKKYSESDEWFQGPSNFLAVRRK